MDKSQIGATFLGLADTDLINVVMRKERLEEGEVASTGLI